MDEKTIKIADKVLEQIKAKRYRRQTMVQHLKGISAEEIDHALMLLKEHRFIKRFEGRGIGEYNLDFRSSEYSTFSDYWANKERKEAEQVQTAKADTEYKAMQSKDLKAKTKRLNPLQIVFWIIIILLTTITAITSVIKCQKGL